MVQILLVRINYWLIFLSLSGYRYLSVVILSWFDFVVQRRWFSWLIRYIVLDEPWMWSLTGHPGGSALRIHVTCFCHGISTRLMLCASWWYDRLMLNASSWQYSTVMFWLDSMMVLVSNLWREVSCYSSLSREISSYRCWSVRIHYSCFQHWFILFIEHLKSYSCSSHFLVVVLFSRGKNVMKQHILYRPYIYIDRVTWHPFDSLIGYIYIQWR